MSASFHTITYNHTTPSSLSESSSSTYSPSTTPLREGPAHIFNLPVEIMREIFGYLPLSERVKAAKVCTLWHSYFLGCRNPEDIYQEIFDKIYGKYSLRSKIELISKEVIVSGAVLLSLNISLKIENMLKTNILESSPEHQLDLFHRANEMIRSGCDEHRTIEYASVEEFISLRLLGFQFLFKEIPVFSTAVYQAIRIGCMIIEFRGIKNNSIGKANLDLAHYIPVEFRRDPVLSQYLCINSRDVALIPLRNDKGQLVDYFKLRINNPEFTHVLHQYRFDRQAFNTIHGRLAELAATLPQEKLYIRMLQKLWYPIIGDHPYYFFNAATPIPVRNDAETLSLTQTGANADALVNTRPIYEENSDAVIEAECATDMDISTLIMPCGSSAEKYVDKAILATVEKVNDTIENLVFATLAPAGIGLVYGMASVLAWTGLATASVAMPALTPLTIKMGAGLCAAYYASVVTAVRVSDAFAIHLDSAIQSQQRIMRQDNVPENVISAYTAKAKTHIEHSPGGHAKIVYPSLPIHPVQAITMEPASV